MKDFFVVYEGFRYTTKSRNSVTARICLPPFSTMGKAFVLYEATRKKTFIVVSNRIDTMLARLAVLSILWLTALFQS